MAASNEDVKRLELFQLQNHEGPCLDAFRNSRPVVNADLEEASDCWPRFAPRATAAGFRSVHAIPLRLRSEVIGAMGVFGSEVGRLDEADVKMAQALAHTATIGWLQERAIRRSEIIVEQLQSAMNSRAGIEQAKGAIAQYRGVSIDDAYLILRAHARRTQRGIGELANSVLTEPNILSQVTDPLSSGPLS